MTLNLTIVSRNDPRFCDKGLKQILDDNKRAAELVVFFYTLNVTYPCIHMNEQIWIKVWNDTENLLGSSNCEIFKINLLDFQDDPDEHLVHALPELVTYRNGIQWHAYCGSNMSQWVSEIQDMDRYLNISSWP